MKAVLIASALALTPTIATAQPAMSPATFVAKAGASDMYEEKSSKLVLSSTKSAAVRDFANMMVADHNTSTAEVKAAAKQAGLTPRPPMLDARQRKNMAALHAATGTARDKLYVSQQKAAHQQALTLHQTYASSGAAPSLKAAAAKIAPVVQTHIDKLAAM